MLGCAQRGLLKELQQEYALLSSDDAAHFSALPIAKVMNKCKPRDTCWHLGRMSSNSADRDRAGAPYLKLYRPFVAGYEEAVATVKRLGQQEAFAAWLKQQTIECGKPPSAHSSHPSSFELFVG